MYTRKKYKGSILVFALIVLSFILIAAFTVAGVTLVERRSANISVNSTVAFQNSDKGMEDFLQQLYKDMKQTDTLGDMAERLKEVTGGSYVCTSSTDEDIAAYIGNVNTEFIISAYKEGDITASGDTRSGWRAVVPITECTEQLANVSRFKVAGNYNTAVRAVFVKLRDSLTRGLLVHWSFEDRAQAARLTNDADKKVSYIAQDTSKNKHVLTLCKMEDDDIAIENEDGEKLGDIKVFSECSKADPYMIPKKEGDCDECDTKGAWVDGIVKELGSVGGALGDDSSTEALYFDGDDYLAMNVADDCDTDHGTFNCIVKDEEDELSPENGITISLWVKPKNDTSDGVLLARRDGTKGFKLYLDDGKFCFQINNVTATCSDTADGDAWHHVVGRWEEPHSGSRSIDIIVDDKKKEGSASFSGPIGDVQGEVLYIATADGSTEFFTGTIDDVRIWNRALTDEEINRLCVDAQGNPAVDALDPKCFTP